MVKDVSVVCCTIAREQQGLAVPQGKGSQELRVTGGQVAKVVTSLQEGSPTVPEHGGADQVQSQ